jgi:hypothetical protein
VVINVIIYIYIYYTVIYHHYIPIDVSQCPPYISTKPVITRSRPKNDPPRGGFEQDLSQDQPYGGRDLVDCRALELQGRYPPVN